MARRGKITYGQQSKRYQDTGGNTPPLTMYCPNCAGIAEHVRTDDDPITKGRKYHIYRCKNSYCAGKKVYIEYPKC